MLQKIETTLNFLKQRITQPPVVGIILGTGLGGFNKEIKIENCISYTEIPGFPVTTVDGHAGNLIIGRIDNVPVVAMQGRFHFFEGYSMDEIIFPVRVMKFLGIQYLMVSNASGGMNPDFNVGDIMIITDHINCMPNPLIGKHYPEFGERFPDMGNAYNKELIEKAKTIAKKNNILLHTGCYVAVTGPTFETPKEYEYFRIIGGDNIGMSTVPEVIAAVQMGIKCFALSVITDLGIAGKVEKITHEEVQNAARNAEWKVSLIISELINSL